MKKITYYQCDVCGHLFSSEIGAKSCEAVHIKPAKIVNYYYNVGAEFPSSLKVKMENGSVFLYKMVLSDLE